MKTKPNILMIGIDYTPFTQEKRGNYWWRLEQYAKSANLIIVTFTPNRNYKTIQHDNITIIPTNCSKTAFMSKAYYMCKEIIEQNKVSLITSQDTTYCAHVASRLKKKFGIPVLMNNYTNKKHNMVERFFHNKNIPHADKIRIESADQKKMFPSHYHNIEIIPIPIDLSSFENKKEKKVVKNCFLWVGRLETEKQPELFLEIARQLPHINFKMIGTGTLFDKLKKASMELENLSMLGHISHDKLPKYYHEAKGLVITSKYEGIPTIVLEAMTAGIPIISTDLEGVKELVEHEKEGFICKDIHELITATMNVNDGETQESLGKNAYKKIKLVYDYKKCLKRITEIWQETIQAHEYWRDAE